jgi:hypothetical protein
MTTATCYSLDDYYAWERQPRPALRKLEIFQVGRREQTKTRSLSSARPTWTDSVETQVSKLLELPANWDSYGACAIRIDAVDTLIKVLRDVMSAATPAPTIVAVADGHLQAEWHTHGVDLEMEVVDPLHIDVWYSGPGGDWHAVLGVDLERLTKAIDQLSR